MCNSKLFLFFAFVFDGGKYDDKSSDAVAKVYDVMTKCPRVMVCAYPIVVNPVPAVVVCAFVDVCGMYIFFPRALNTCVVYECSHPRYGGCPMQWV